MSEWRARLLCCTFGLRDKILFDTFENWNTSVLQMYYCFLPLFSITLNGFFVCTTFVLVQRTLTENKIQNKNLFLILFKPSNEQNWVQSGLKKF